MVVKQKVIIRCFEVFMVVAIVVIAWLVMLLPIAIYFLPLSTGQTNQVPKFNNFSDVDELQNTTIDTGMVACQNLQSNIDGNNTEPVLVCREDFFPDPADGSQCKPQCNTWLMFSRPAEMASKAIIGLSTVIGILTTLAIIILSFVRFRSMLVFPSVLVLYQDILVSVHGFNILIGYMDRRLFCTSDDLIESYRSSSSPYCTFSGLISGQVVLPLAIWITIQVGYTLLAVRTPLFFKRLTMNKKRQHILHVVSLLIGLVALLVSSLLTLGLTGYGLVDTIFPPIVCIARNRDVTTFTILIPLGVLSATIITMLVLILHRLVRNRCMNETTNKDLKTAEIKVFVICCCYVILGLGASLAWSISSAFLDDHQRELFGYFECERCGVDSGQMCDRSGFERLTNPPLITIGYSLFVLYPVITLVYIVRFKRGDVKHTIADVNATSKSTSF